MTRFVVVERLAIAASVALAVAACGGGDKATGPTGPPTSMVLASGVAPGGRAGQIVVDSPSVLVSNAAGQALPGVTVTFTVLTGGGNVLTPTIVTGANGIARARWTLGGTVGSQTLKAIVTSLTPIVFSATVTAGPSATLTIISGDGQAAASNALLATAFKVQSKDAFSNPVAGDTIVFSPSSGASVLTGATQLTDVNGFATLGSWTVPQCAGAASVTARRGGAVPIQAVATATVTGSTGYCLELLFTQPPDPTLKLAADRAAARWGKIITSSFAPETLNLPGPAGGPSSVPTCAQITVPSIPNRIVKSLLIVVELAPIASPGPGLVTLGSAGPCLIRVPGNLTVFGGLKLNSDYLLDRTKISDTAMFDVVLHEMGHVLGYGTLWASSSFALLSNGIPASQPTTTMNATLPTFNGPITVAAYHALGGPAGDVPVEGCGGQGTVNGHWRESVFGDELMTGYISAPPNQHNPLSIVTIKSFADMGYTVDVAQADGYAISGKACPAGTAYNPGTLIGVSALVGETLVQPTHYIRGGKIFPIVRR